MAPRKTATLDPVKVCSLALKQVKSASDYHQIGVANSPETLTAAWEHLTELEQTRITNIVNNDTSPTPEAIADELAACGTLIQLEAIKASYGDIAVKTAWKLLPKDERDRLTAVCKNEPRQREEVPPVTETPTLYKVEPAPSKLAKRNLIELTSDLRQLDELLDTIDGDIPVELQTAVNELLAQRDVTNDAVQEKLDNYAALIQSRLLWAAARKAEADRLAKLAESDFKVVDFLKDRLKEHLEATDQKKLRTKRFNISVRTAGGKQGLRLNVESPDKLPQRFQRVTIEPDNQLLREALEAGDIEAAEVAYLAERSTYVAIN